MFHNVGILAHVDSGKTTLTEQLLYLTGVIRAAGTVDGGTTATDNLTVEKQRGISVRTSTATAKHGDVIFNLIDTPGHVDFAGEVERSLSALDYAIVVISAVEGVMAHTENILKALDDYRLPAIVFINKIDRVGTDIDRVMTELSEVSSRTPVLFSSVLGAETDSPTVTTLSGVDFAERVTEALCEVNDEAAEAFLSDESLSEKRAFEITKEETSACRVMPVLCGSAKLSVGIKELISLSAEIMPSSERRGTESLSGVIFKIEHDKTMGKISHVRLFGGQLRNRDEVELILPKNDTVRDDSRIDEVSEKKGNPKEKITQIRKFIGGKYTDSGEVKAGDIAALCGLTGAKTGQYIGNLAQGGAYKMASPFLRVKVTPKEDNPEAIPRLAEALSQLSDEEPYLDSKWENGQREITISTMGKIQIEVIDSLLKEKYGIAADFSPPSVIYKETPTKKGIAYADYTMPKPCWAVVQFEFEPMERGYGVSYHGRLPSNQCFYRYQNHIRTSFFDCLKQGLYGWEVTDFKCTLVGGQHHTIHTHPLDFFVCTPMAFMNGLQSMGVTILEPLLKMRVSVPTNLLGKIINEVTRMGGEYDSPVMLGDTSVIEAIVPAAESMDFPQKLASVSSGKGTVNVTFHGYRECRDGKEHVSERRGVNPLDRSKWILWARGAYQLSIDDM